MNKQIRPFLIIGLCMAMLNITVVRAFGQMDDLPWIIMIVGNIILVICNTLAANKFFKDQEK